MTHANLMHPEPLRARPARVARRTPGFAVWASVMGLTTCGLGAWWWTLWREGVRVDRELSHLQSGVSHVREMRGRSEAMQRSAEQLARVVQELQAMRSAQRAAAGTVEAIGRAVPGDCWLEAVVDEGAGGVRIDGRSPALSSLFAFVARLEAAGVFPGGVEVLESHAGHAGGPDADVIGFSVKALTRPRSQVSSRTEPPVGTRRSPGPR